jgi:glycerophosphoryl diester phosphodiesterase
MTLKNIIPILAASLLIISSCGSAKKAASSSSKSAKHNFPALHQKGMTAIVAHRGFWNCAAAGFAKNSIASLREAQKHEFWGSECDVHLTSDFVPIVFHDPTIRGREIQKNTFETFLSHRLKNGESIPTFDEYLTQAEQSEKTILVIELKPQYSPEHEEKLVELVLKAVKAHGLYDKSRVAFISFSKHICDILAKECPAFTNQYLNGDISPEALAADGINGLDYKKSVIFQDTSIVERAQALGMSTNSWTVNKADEMQKLFELGIDAITTDEPLLLRDLLDRKEFKNK